MIQILPFSSPLIIRTDANPSIGTGHVMRCLALAQIFHDAGTRVIFVLSGVLPSLEERLKSEGMEILHISSPAGSQRDAEDTVRIANECGSEWIVVDGYQFGKDYQRTIRDAGLYDLFIDDYGHAGYYYADLVVNQNIYAGMSFYPAHEPYTRFLLGTDFVLLRKEFVNLPRHDQQIPNIARKILITLGGCDPDNITLTIIQAIKSAGIPDIEIIAVLGGANPHSDIIDLAVKGYPWIAVLKNADNMPELMAWADCAISAGGSTCWELLFMNVPTIVIPLVANQVPVAQELQSRSLACVLSLCDIRDPDNLVKTITCFLQSHGIRAGFSRRMAGYVDGRGPARIISAMETSFMSLRKAEPADCEQVWVWINDPHVRSVSFNQEPIPLESHRDWFFSALNDPNLVYYLAVDRNAGPIGQARFRIVGKEAVISVLVASDQRGKARGSQLIRAATKKLFMETSVETVKAFIKTGNEASRKAFAQAGYTDHGKEDSHGEPALIFIKARSI